MSKSFKSPPSMRSGLSYEDWKKEITIWKSFTDLDSTKQGPALYLSLEGRTRDAVLADIDISKISEAGGLDVITQALDKMFLKDRTESGFEAFDNFIKYRRPENVPVDQYITEFNIRYNKLKDYKMELPEGVLAYALLTCANLPQEQEQLARATCQELNYKEMKKQIERIQANPKTKQAEPFISASSNDFYEYEDYERHNDDTYYEDQAIAREENTLFTQQNPNVRRGMYNKSATQPRVNQPDESGRPTKCGFCHSIYHYIRDCPDAQQGRRGTNTQGRSRGRGGPRGRSLRRL